jgi:peptidoglycan/LPS O-acetylase OafA/YrhL
VTDKPAPPFVGGRIPSLDGLRAVSIAMVCFAHMAGTRFFPSLVAIRRDLGNLGVRVFFVISGFLITTLLVEEFSRSGRISLGRFYLRRAFRILPCAYVYIGMAAVLSLAGVAPVRLPHLLHAATYTVNYDPDRPWSLIHLWSLSVEEQFYFIWPVLLCLLRPKKALWFAAAVILLAPLTRISIWFWAPTLRWSIGTAFQTNADALAAGCVLAGIWPGLSQSDRYLRFLRSRTFLLVPVAGLAACFLLSHQEGPLVILSLACGQTVLNLSIALCLDRSVRHAKAPTGRVLNWRPMVFIGALSYSLYLWQEPFLNRLGTSVLNWFPLNLALAFAAALSSYYLIERPFLGLRKRMEQRRKRAAACHMKIPGRITPHINIGLNESAAEMR